LIAGSPPPAVSEHDVAVLGGGPAGCAAAILLARRGHDVLLVRPSTPPAGALAESVPPSTRKLLADLGLLHDMERAGFHPNGGNTVWWAGGQGRVEAFPDGGHGFHVDRAGLERIMASAARAAGVRVHDATVRAAAESPEGWIVRCRAEGGPDLEIRTPWVLDATGRSGVVARGLGREHDRDTATLALVRRWRRKEGFRDVEATHTLVESYASGWAWSVPLDPEVRCLTAMVDRRHADLSGSDLNAALDAELDKAPRIGALRSGAVPVGPAWACPASLYTASRFAWPGILLVGDSGSFIDPLSSFGVKKALSSGWLAGIVVHTALDDPGMTETATKFFDERERDVYRKYRARSADFFEACAKTYRHEYWTTRARSSRIGGDSASHTAEPDLLDEDGVPASEAKQALDVIRARPGLDAEPGSSIRIVERPTVVGHRIVLAEHLASDRLPHGLRWVRNVDLRRLVEVAPAHAEVPTGWAAYNEGAPAVPLPDYLAALGTAFAAGFLRHADR